MFNRISLLWEAFVESSLKEAGRNVRLYAYGDNLNSHQRENFQQSWPFFDLQGFEHMTSLFSNQPVRSLAALLKQSETHPVCFSYLLTGLSGELDHYNFEVPLEKWREFAAAIRFHFQVQETLRLNPKEHKDQKFLERFAPEDALRGSSDLLSLIKPINYKTLTDRPRLTIIDRHTNRKILNIQNLHQTALETGFFKSVQVVYLEELDISSQIRLMTVTDVLFGMDGTGLMNGLFLPEGGVVVHIRPYGCARFLQQKGVNFDRMWASNPGRVIRYESGDPNSTRFPTDIVEVPQLAFNLSSPYNYRAAFILKQDSIIDLKVFRCILEDAHRLLYGVAVEWEKHKACTRTVFF